jgi:hypothetical protein
MASDPSQPVVLSTHTTEFQAATLARALEARGIQARVVGALTTGFRAEAPGVAKVMVLQRDLERAKAAVEAIRAEGTDDIDWSEAEAAAPPPDAAPAERITPERSWGWTVALVILLPVGLFVTWLGNRPGADAISRAIGPVILGIALVLIAWLLMTGSDSSAADDNGA